MSGMPHIDMYDFGRIEIDGRLYTSDVIILSAEVRPNWRRDEGHVLKPVDLGAIFQALPQTLVVGRGAYGQMRIPAETVDALKGAGVELICATTPEAVTTYNDRADAGRNVAAALHLTC